MSAGFASPVVAAGVVGLGLSYADGTMTPPEVIETYLERIARHAALSAFVDLDAERARTDARASAGRHAGATPLSPMDGVPIGVKSNIAVAGLPWTAGVAAYRGRIAAADAAAVTTLRRAGAIILGTVAMHEAALGATTDNVAYDRCHNPWRIGHTPGGSSGGSAAAVAAGLCAAALGTDTLGSVRVPSAYCGVLGLKPARAVIARDGVVPLSPTLDAVGLHARSADDCAALLAAFAPAEPPLLPARVGTWRPAGVALAPAIEEAFSATIARLRALGVTCEAIADPELDLPRLRRLGLFIAEAEAARVHRHALVRSPAGFSPAFRDATTWAERQSPAKLAAAYDEVRSTAARIVGVWTMLPAVLLPATPQQAFAFTDEAPASQADLTALANILDWPAIAFPVGLAGGLPLSMQALGPRAGPLLALARALALPPGAPPGLAV